MPFPRKALLKTTGFPHSLLLTSGTPLELNAVPGLDPPWQKIRTDWGAHQVGTTIDPVATVGGMDLTRPLSVGPLFVCAQGMGALKCTFNFGATAFSSAAPSGFSAWGSGTTLDPTKTSSNMVLSNGNLTMDSTGFNFTDGGQSPSTTSHSTGKWYFEVTYVATNSGASTAEDEGIGFTATPQKISPPIPWQGQGQDPLQLGFDELSAIFVLDSFVIWDGFGLNRINNGTSAVAPANGDVWGFAVDLDHKRFWLRKNSIGTWWPLDTSCAFMQFHWANAGSSSQVLLDLQQGNYDLGHSPARFFLNGMKKIALWGYGTTINPSFDGNSLLLGAFAHIRQDVNRTGRVHTVSAGDTSATLINSFDISKFSVGDWCLLCTFDLQGQAGYPPNHQNCEYVHITAINGTAIVFDRPVVALSGPYVTTAPDHGVNQQPVLGTGAGAFGFAKIRLTVPDTSSMHNGDLIIVSGVTGTVEANGTWNAFVADATHVDLEGSPPFVNPYTGGGTAIDYFTYDVGGPAALINVSGGARPGDPVPDPILFYHNGDWDVEIEFYGCTFISANFQSEFGGAGRYVAYIGCKFVYSTPVPSMTKHWVARYCTTDFNAGQIELDKECELVEFDNCFLRSIAGQSASIQQLTIKNCKIDIYGAGLNGTPKNCTITNTVFPLLIVGCSGYGQSKTLNISNCSSPNARYDASGSASNIAPVLTQRLDTSIVTYANGVFTSAPGTVLNMAVPGLVWYGGNGNGLFAFAFNVVDVRDDGTNTETVKIITDIPSSHPFYTALPALTPTNFWISGIPAPVVNWSPCESITVTNSTSYDGVLNELSNPDAAGLPFGSYTNRTVTGRLIGGLQNLFGPGSAIFAHAWGRLVSITIDVQRAYTGAQASCLWRSGQADFWTHVNPAVSFDAIFTLLTVVNLKIAGKRVITPTSVTGLQSGDNIPVPGAITLVGENFIPFIDCDMTADTDAQSPIVNFIVRTDQSSQFS